MLDAYKLRTLAELDRLGTIAAVAGALHLTAPGVSMQLAALERETGVALTERQGRRVVLTAAGRILARHGRDIADLVTIAELEVGALREGSAGTYRVAAFPTAACTFVALAWRALQAAPAPGLGLHLLELEPEDALPALASGEVDLAITHAYSNLPELARPGLVAAPLAVEDVYLAVPSGDRRKAATVDADVVRLGDYARHDWILPDPRWACHEMVARACGAAGFSPRSVAEANDYSVQFALVAAGVGVALVPSLAAENSPRGVRLHRLQRPVRRHIFSVTRSSARADPGLREVARLVASAAADRFAADRAAADRAAADRAAADRLSRPES